MKITAIKQQARQPSRYSIFLDGKYTFSLSDTVLLESQLANGQELTEVQVREYKQLSADDKLYGRALHYALMRPHSTWEMETYLQRKKVAPPLLSRILSKLSNIGLLDDEAFARSWVANRRLLKPTSRRRLVQELRAKRVADEVIEQVLKDNTDEAAVLREVIARKRKQTKYQNNLKLMQYLARQGFNYEAIKQALGENEV